MNLVQFGITLAFGMLIGYWITVKNIEPEKIIEEKIVQSTFNIAEEAKGCSDGGGEYLAYTKKSSEGKNMFKAVCKIPEKEIYKYSSEINSL